MRSTLPGPLGDEVRRELARVAPASGMAIIVEAWPAAVGRPIAENAWPARLGRDGTLHVTVSSSTWAYELSQLAEMILARLREHLGDASPPALRFAPGPLPERGLESVETPARFVPEVNPAQRAEGERVAAGIGAPELRKLVARAAAASLAARSAAPRNRPF